MLNRLSATNTIKEYKMIVYTSEKAISALNIKTYDKIEGAQSLLAKYHYDKEKDDVTLAWGCETFYFMGKRGLQVVHAASGLTVFLFNLNYDEPGLIGQQIKSAVGHLFEETVDIHPQLKKFFAAAPDFVFVPLTDKALASQLQRITLETAEGLDFHNYLENGVLRTRKLNSVYNYNKLFAFGKGHKKDTKAAQAFINVLKEHYHY
ncbi:MAG: hypothetical protein J1F39_04205 [Clostridiales bacterium]|nr:hypothetical protein [Clostridiales bacterium]